MRTRMTDLSFLGQIEEATQPRGPWIQHGLEVLGTVYAYATARAGLLGDATRMSTALALGSLQQALRTTLLRVFESGMLNVAKVKLRALPAH